MIPYFLRRFYFTRRQHGSRRPFFLARRRVGHEGCGEVGHARRAIYDVDNDTTTDGDFYSQLITDDNKCPRRPRMGGGVNGCGCDGGDSVAGSAA